MMQTNVNRFSDLNLSQLPHQPVGDIMEWLDQQPSVLADAYGHYAAKCAYSQITLNNQRAWEMSQ